MVVNLRSSISFASAWDLVRSKSPLVPYYAVIWYSGTCPKWASCLLRTLNDRLPTKARFEELWYHLGGCLCAM